MAVTLDMNDSHRARVYKGLSDCEHLTVRQNISGYIIVKHRLLYAYTTQTSNHILRAPPTPPFQAQLRDV